MATHKLKCEDCGEPVEMTDTICPACGEGLPEMSEDDCSEECVASCTNCRGEQYE
jgi:hypothetical protein